jgi:hypothetical protein
LDLRYEANGRSDTKESSNSMEISDTWKVPDVISETRGKMAARGKIDAILLSEIPKPQVG